MRARTASVRWNASKPKSRLNITDPMAVDVALAPDLDALELAVRDHRSI
jgi:hypothetical protein